MFFCHIFNGNYVQIITTFVKTLIDKKLLNVKLMRFLTQILSSCLQNSLLQEQSNTQVLLQYEFKF